MNFFTNPWKTEDIIRVACDAYKPNVFHDENEPFIILDMLKFKNTKKPCDPMFIFGALLTRSGCDEGLALIKDKLEIYLKQINKIPQDFEFDILVPDVRIKLFRELAKDPSFIRNELRLKLIEIIEELD